MNSGGAPQQLVTGAQYVEQISALESDRRARAAFQSVVLSIAPPGGSLFDFGAGPGTDARFYAEHGYTVAAYDVDPQMCEYFATHCRDLIDAGRITLERGSYRDFLARERGGTRRADLVTANFAPLNLIDDLQELFATLHALTGPGGKVLASVLSPYFIGDLKYDWWWRNCWQLWRKGHFSVQGAQARIVRRRLADFAAQCAPYFALKQVIPGLSPRRARQAKAIDLSRASGYAWLHVTTCRFMFLLFEKQDLRAENEERRRPPRLQGGNAVHD